jgi:3-oxoacyl-[acyl-carrier protein] reductase
MDLQLGGKTAIVLAASKGLGKASAMALAAEGADVVIGARDPKVLENAAAEIKAAGRGRVVAVAMDVNKPEDMDRIVSAAMEAYGRIDILVNNAGGPPFGPFDSFDDKAWQAAFDLNLLSVVRCSRLVIPHMKAIGSGRIINIVSLSVKTYLEHSVLSTTMRMGVVGMAKILSNELGPFQITVNNVAPGLILTDRIKDTVAHQVSAGATLEELLAARVKNIPVRRLGRPDELGALVAFLSSPLAGYITGATIQIDGGSIQAPY